MGSSFLAPLLLLTIVSCGFAEIIWVDKMDPLRLQEALPFGEKVYTLRATVGIGGSSAGVIYGFNNKQNGDTTIDPLSTFFRINTTTGEVFTYGNKLDYEIVQSREFKVNLIAKLADDSQYSYQVSTVTLTNINDEKPVFKNNSLTAFIQENKVIDPNVGYKALEFITVEDVDNIITAPAQFLNVLIQYCKIGTTITDCSEDFELRRTGSKSTKEFIGDFIIKRPLDFETANKIQVQLLATDGDQNNDVTSDIVVEVQDLQDVPPVWITLPALVNTNDETQPGQLNVPIYAQDQDTGNRPIYYEFIPGQQVGGHPITSVFQIVQTNSTNPASITNIIEIDLDDTVYFRNYTNKEVFNEWPLQILACEIIDTATMTVGNTALECTNIGTVKIQIDDINDNAPTFNQRTYEYSIFEDVANGNVLDDPRIEIFDKDTESYNKFTSSLLTPSNEFAVLQARNPAIVVKNSSLIDYDNGPHKYIYTLQTIDINDNSLFDRAQIIINIMDVNDNRPQFGAQSYNRSIPEDAPEGYSIININATDIDSGDMGTRGIQYFLEGPQAYVNLFRIDPLTGLVTVDKCNLAKHGVNPCLDYDIPPRNYALTVVAVDDKGQGLRSSIPLTVSVLDVNDNPPAVPNYERSILEDQRQFNPELKVQGTDADEQTVLRYSISAQGPGAFWKIDSITGVITVDKPAGQGIKFKDGTSGRFDVTVAVTDGIYTAYSDVKITVIDINDNAPRFSQDIYQKTINETIPAGSSILQITATDEDDPTSANGQLEYNLDKGNVGGKFTLNKETGVLSVSQNVVFDFEVQNFYNMTAFVNDKGTPQQRHVALIYIYIKDENNRDPVVDPLLQQFEVYDNAQFGHILGNIVAKDPDDNAVLRFFSVDPKTATSDEGYRVNRTVYDYTTLFRVDPINGNIIVNTNDLDSKITSIVTYGILVQDITPTTPQNGSGTIIIQVKPFNIEPPKFELFPDPIVIDEEQPIGSVVVSLIATDNNGIREFSIIEQPDDNFFSVSATTGAVTVFNRIDYERDPFVNTSYCVVRVTDTGEPQLSATTRVNVVFRNINDNIPEFMDEVYRTPVNVYTATIDENSANNVSIGKAFAFDRDRPDINGYDDVRYSMNDDRFDVDPITGQMFVRLQGGQELDRELHPRILTQVIARDCPLCPEVQRRQSVATVQVTLRDVNDNPPIFSRDSYYVKIFETIGVGTEILQLFTSDADLGNHAISYYYKVPNMGDDFSNFFDVRERTGKIYVAKNLVRHVGIYNFYVKAKDNLGTGHETEVKVTVDVQPSANSPPVWVIPPVDNMTIYVLEEQYNGMLIYDVSASDDDTGNNGIVDYSIIYNGEETQNTPEFQINRVTGVISAEIVYDRERVNKYVILLKAKDRGETPLETTRFLTIVIKDVNDNRPRFTKESEEFRVSENSPKDYYVGSVTATDPDENPVIVYDIIAGNEDGVFRLNRSTGVLHTNRVLDRELKSVYYLDILASNNEPDYTVITSRRRRAVDNSIITVKISVGDINDLAPVFLQDQYYGCISSRAPYDKHIMTIQAIDRDAVGTGIVRYSTVEGHIARNGQKLFDIHEKFGVVTNKVLMQQYAKQTFQLKINARDGEDVATSESANTTALVFVSMPGNEVRLEITQNTGEVRLYQSQIQSIIEKADDVDYVCINDIKDHLVDSAGTVSSLWSDVYVTGVRRVYDPVTGSTTYKMLSATEFANIIHREKSSRSSDFDLLYIRTIEERSSSDEVKLDDSAVLIILIIVAILIFLVIIFCIVAFMCIRLAKQQKKHMLIQKTHETPAPVMVVEAEPEPVIYDNRAYIQEEPVRIIREEHIVQEEPRVIENPAVHVQYAMVQKRSPSPRIVEQDQPYEPVHYVTEDDQDAIVVELKDDEPRMNVYQADDDDYEYRIETEVEPQRM